MMSHSFSGHDGVPAPSGFLSQEQCRALFARLTAMRTGGGDINLSMVTRWVGSAKWARSRMHALSDARENDLTLNRSVRGATWFAKTTRIDDAGLRQALDDAETSARYTSPWLQLVPDPLIDVPILKPTLWSEATYAWDAAARTATAQQMMAASDAAHLLAAGELKIAGQGHAVLHTNGLQRYYPVTVVECSMTVRDPQGTASGWAGISHYDLAKVDTRAIAARALEKCQRSANPVGIEPGRYTAILEPQAVADLLTPLVEDYLGRRMAEEGRGPFAYAHRQSKIGQRVLDPRLNLSADPMHPDAGFVPFDQDDGTPYRAVTWIDRGVLRELAYDREYAVQTLQFDQALLNSKSYTLAPAPGVSTRTVDDMIAATERGILVTRFSRVRLIDSFSAVSVGYTRDGTWLIERGKIAKAIKNFRFTESPLFALNNLIDVSDPVRVFSPGAAIMAPAVRVKDFSFTSLADAV